MNDKTDDRETSRGGGDVSGKSVTPVPRGGGDVSGKSVTPVPRGGGDVSGKALTTDQDAAPTESEDNLEKRKSATS